MHFFVATVILFFELVFFYLLGSFVISRIEIDVSGALKPILGCFTFYAIINPIYLICVYMRFSVTTFGVFVVAVVLTTFFLYIFLEKPKSICISRIKEYILESAIYKTVLILFFGVMLYYAVRSGYVGWDTSAYVQCIRDAAFHNTLYEYYQPGAMGQTYGLKYILCSYYMVLAFITRVTSIPAIIIARCVGGGCCVIFSALIVFAFSEEIFSNNRIVFISTILWVLLGFIDVSIYTASSFLMERSYEGKAWCANVILPFLLLLFYHIFRKTNDRKWWLLVYIVCLSCNSISMSAMLSAPMMVSICSAMIMIKERKLYIIRNWIICVSPLMIYGMIYLLSVKGFIRIMA